jgi:hypothetical protein
MESHQHRLAKELLASWIPGRWSDLGTGRVFTEYPMCFLANGLRFPPHPRVETGLSSLWDETGWEHQMFPEGHPRIIPHVGLGAGPIPTYDELCAANAPPAVIADIVVSHKDRRSTIKCQ